MSAGVMTPRARVLALALALALARAGAVTQVWPPGQLVEYANATQQASGAATSLATASWYTATLSGTPYGSGTYTTYYSYWSNGHDGHQLYMKTCNVYQIWSFDPWAGYNAVVNGYSPTTWGSPTYMYVNSFLGVPGDFLGITMPQGILPSSYSLQMAGTYLYSWILFASNDRTNWYAVDVRVADKTMYNMYGSAPNDGLYTATFAITGQTVAYSSYVLVLQSVYSATGTLGAVNGMSATLCGLWFNVANAAPAAPPPPAASSGAVLHLSFENNVSDTSGVGVTTYNASTAGLAYAAGAFGRALSVSATMWPGIAFPNYAVPATVAYPATVPSPLTIAFWVNWQSVTAASVNGFVSLSSNGFFAQWYSTLSAPQAPWVHESTTVSFGFNGPTATCANSLVVSTLPCFQVSCPASGGVGSPHTTACGAFGTGAWYHVALTVDAAANATLYLNGTSRVTWSNAQMNSYWSDVLVQSGGTGSAYLLDELYVYAGALSAAQVSALFATSTYAAAFPPLPPPSPPPPSPPPPAAASPPLPPIPAYTLSPPPPKPPTGWSPPPPPGPPPPPPIAPPPFSPPPRPPSPPSPPSPPPPAVAVFTVPAQAAHRFTFLSVGGAAPLPAALVVDTGASSAWTPVAGSGVLNVSAQPGFGRALDSPAAAIDLGGRDYAGEAASVAFWLYRTSAAATVGATTALLSILGSGFAAYNLTVAVAGKTVDLAWPGCAGTAKFAPPGALDAQGYHQVAVAFSAVGSVAVFVDGAAASYVSQSAVAAPACDLAGSAMPPSLPAAHAWLGSFGAADAGVWALLDASFFARALNASEVAAAWRAASAPVALGAPPPPFVAPAAPAGNAAPKLPRLTACQYSPPIHRYGDFQGAPFANDVLRDANATQPWPGSWRSALGAAAATTSAAVNGYATLGSLQSYYSNGSFVDLGGPHTFTGSGLTVGMLLSNGAMAAAPCSPTATFGAGAAWPSSTAYFDVGGYAAFSVVSACTPGLVGGAYAATTYVTSPTSQSTFSGAGTVRSPLLPMLNERYLWVTFGRGGARVYVSGALWATFPTVTYESSAPFVAPYVRFYPGDAYGGGTAAFSVYIRDIQLYDRELSAGDVASLTRGIGSTC